MENGRPQLFAGRKRGFVVTDAGGELRVLPFTDAGDVVLGDGTTGTPGGGSGLGDVVGPASAVDDRIATFDGTTGKLIQDGGKTIATVLSDALTAASAALPNVTLAGTPNYLTIVGQVITRALIDLTTHVTGLLPNANLANMAQSTLKGRAAGAGTGVPTDLSVAQVLAILEAEFDAGNSGSAKTIDWANGRQQICTLTADCTFTLSNPTNGVAYRLLLVQDGTGGWTPMFPSSVQWEGGSPPAWVTTAANVIFVSLVRTGVGADGYLGFATLQAIAQP